MVGTAVTTRDLTLASPPTSSGHLEGGEGAIRVFIGEVEPGRGGALPACLSQGPKEGAEASGGEGREKHSRWLEQQMQGP